MSPAMTKISFSHKFFVRMASSTSATDPKALSGIVDPSLTIFSTGKSEAVAQRSKCLYLSAFVTKNTSLNS